MILLDANVLLRLIQIGHPHQQPALDAIALLGARNNESFASCPQVLYEMYAVCTRPLNAPNPGLGLTAAAAVAQIEAARRQFPLEPETDTVFSRWQSLALKYGMQGKSSHDAHLVALMIERKLPVLLTFNDAHFARYAEITVLNPFQVLGIPRV